MSASCGLSAYDLVAQLKALGVSLSWSRAGVKVSLPWPFEEIPEGAREFLREAQGREEELAEALAPRLLFCPTCKRLTLHINLACQLCRSKGECLACKGSNFWVSRYGRRVCRTCHPPAPGAEAV
jgi:hypothetical protein